MPSPPGEWLPPVVRRRFDGERRHSRPSTVSIRPSLTDEKTFPSYYAHPCCDRDRRAPSSSNGNDHKQYKRAQSTLPGCILRWGGATVTPRRYTGGTHSTGGLGTRGAPVAATNRHGWAPGGAATAGVCAQAGEFGFRGVGLDVSCAGAALRCHPVGTPAEPTPQLSWALGGRRWPPPIAAVGPLGALPRPGCAQNRDKVSCGGLGQMYPSLGRRCGVTPSVRRRNPLHR